MLLQITTTAWQATDLGYLLHKNPANVFEKSLPFGTVRVFYPEASDDRCTAALWLDIDPVGLVRRAGDNAFALAQYVNDRPYVASSFLSVAIGQAFSTALAGRCKDRPQRVGERWPLAASLPAVDCDAGEGLIRDLFTPLGYQIAAERLPLDARFPEWGASSLYAVTLAGDQTVQDLLSHLYVLLPVLDNQKHYYVGAEEVEKLLDNGGAWLAAHPKRDIIARRYLRYKRRFIDEALERLSQSSRDEAPVPLAEAGDAQAAEEALERPLRLHDVRLQAVAQALKAGGGHRALDLGCGEGQLLRLLAADPQWTEIVGMDVSPAALAVAERRLHRDSPGGRIRLLQGSLLYLDDRLTGYDAAALVEVIEHVEPDRLDFLARAVFGHARPSRVVVTTPNAEYNPHWPSLPAGKFRHRDHRFEWTRAQFADWAGGISSRFGYAVTLSDLGEPDGDLGAPSQMAVFER
ncbi:MAG: 3' terminal RNA ribose 2'-O-methyltransferase Hen1 [Armatimonadetes bacterium]|nr:3' terminal RNA ribose 2'-O-methyltransferase Hen1 [Armatimonadota bacterium]